MTLLWRCGEAATGPSEPGECPRNWPHPTSQREPKALANVGSRQRCQGREIAAQPIDELFWVPPCGALPATRSAGVFLRAFEAGALCFRQYRWAPITARTSNLHKAPRAELWRCSTSYLAFTRA